MLIDINRKLFGDTFVLSLILVMANQNEIIYDERRKRNYSLAICSTGN